MAAKAKARKADQGALWSMWQLEQAPGQGDIFDVAEMVPATDLQDTLFAVPGGKRDGDGGPVSPREAQRWEAFLPDGVRLSEATQEELREAVTAGRAYTPDRVAQGFRTEAHWEAFLRFADHDARCHECGQPGPAMWLEGSASWQPTARLCPEGLRLQAVKDAGGCETCAGVQERTGHFLTREQLTDIHSVDHACPCCESTAIVVTGVTEHGLTACECRACPAVFVVSFDVTGPVALRYISKGHRAAR